MNLAAAACKPHCVPGADTNTSTYSLHGNHLPKPTPPSSHGTCLLQNKQYLGDGSTPDQGFSTRTLSCSHVRCHPPHLSGVLMLWLIGVNYQLGHLCLCTLFPSKGNMQTTLQQPVFGEALVCTGCCVVSVFFAHKDCNRASKQTQTLMHLTAAERAESQPVMVGSACLCFAALYSTLNHQRLHAFCDDYKSTERE